MSHDSARRARMARETLSNPTLLGRTGAKTRRGFTLIEMLVVIAILGILIGLLFIPLIRSFGFVGREQAQIQLQNVTKEALRLVTGQLSEAMEITLFPENPTRIDLVLPGSALVNQPKGFLPSMQAGTVALPGQMWETFFVGLADPGPPQPLAPTPYNNPVSRKVAGGITSAQVTPENEYIIWRAVYNLNDPNDPVAKAVGGKASVLAADPWFFEDSLKQSITTPGVALATGQPAVSPQQRTLLAQMRNYTARYLAKDANGNPIIIPVGAELTPVAVTSHLDAVRSRWDQKANGGAGGWIIDPRVTFLPSTSHQELMAPSEFGTQFQTAKGQWVGTGASAPITNIYWPLVSQNNPSGNFGAVYGGATLNGSIMGGDGQPMNITVLNGPNAGMVISNQVNNVPPFFLDPRTGRITFTQFEVRETIAVAANTNVYPLYFPNQSFLSGQSDTNYVTLHDPNNPQTNLGVLHPQIIPFSDTLYVQDYTNGAPNAGGPALYQRLVGNTIANNNNLQTQGVAQGQPPIGGELDAQKYAINYVSSIDTSLANKSYWPDMALARGWGNNYQLYADEVPLIEIPAPIADSLIQPMQNGTGSILQVFYRFTFSTLGADGNPMARAAASYQSQQFVHVNVGFRIFDESTSTPQDFQLADSVGSANPIDEQPNAE